MANIEHGLLPLTRRSVLSGLGLSSAVLGGATLPEAFAATVSVQSLHVVCESDLAPAVAFSNRMKKEHRAAIHMFSGDVAPIWFGRIQPELRAKPGLLAGLTEIGALFCFEQLAWDLGMRVYMRIDHFVGTDKARHVVTGTDDAGVQALLSGTEGNFGETACDAIMASRAGWHDCTHQTKTTCGDNDKLVLASWVMLPRGVSV